MKNRMIKISKDGGLVRVRIMDSTGKFLQTMHVWNSPEATEVYFTDEDKIEIVDLEREFIETPENQNA